MWSLQNRHFRAKSIKNSRKQVKNGSFSADFWSKRRDFRHRWIFSRLPLTSKLDALCAEHANSILLRRVQSDLTRLRPQKKKEQTTLCGFSVRRYSPKRWRCSRPAPWKQAFRSSGGACELQASSTRSRKNMFFEHHCLHIVRIFREITPFCTLFPLFPYRTFPVVVSYVVKPKIRLKAENGEPDKALLPINKPYLC